MAAMMSKASSLSAIASPANRGGVAGSSLVSAGQAAFVRPAQQPCSYTGDSGARRTRERSVSCYAQGLGHRLGGGHASYGKPLQRVEAALLADCPPSESQTRLAARPPAAGKHSAEEVLPAWFELCLGDLVRNLDKAPFLEAVYDAQSLLSRGTQFVTHKVTSGSFAGPGAWDEVARLPDGRSAKTLIFVHRVSDPSDCPCGQPTVCDDCPHTQAANTLLRQGSIGDCCDEDLYEPPHHSHGETRTKYWGLVIQSSLPGDPKGCYMLKTEQNVGADCSCTHFSLTKVCQAVPLERQLVEAWTC